MRRRRTAAVLLLVGALGVGGCTSDVVSGRAVQPSGAAFTDAAGAGQILRDVREGLAAVNTYDYRNLPAARSKALQYVTGQLRTSLANTFDTILTKQAPALLITQQGVVDQIGLAGRRGATATVLAFGHLNITSGSSATRRDPFTVVATARRTGSEWKMSRLDVGGTINTARATAVAGNAQLAQAVRAARASAVANSSFTRADFDADYDRALELTTGQARRDLQKSRATILRSLTTGGFDLTGEVRAVAVARTSGTVVQVLVSLTGLRIKNTRRSNPTQQRLLLTVQRAGSQWLVSKFGSVT